MKVIFVIIGILLGVFFVPAYAQVTSEFGYQIHPEKLLENTEGTMQVFVISNEMMVPKDVENLKVISSDNAIIQILSVEDGNDEFSKNVKIKAKKPGITSIALAASGFLSKEISLEVFNNNNHPTKILMKATPNKFSVDGPKYGYVAIELATTGGLPTLTNEDVLINLDTPNKDVIKLKDSEVMISKGEYYVITEFEIVGSGDAIIFAESDGMEKISKLVKVLEADGPLKLQLYVYPKIYNSYGASAGVAIVQLLDGEGEPILAEEDIHLELEVENPNISINTSHDFEEIDFDKKQLVIKKGEYSTFTKFTPRPNLGDFTEAYTQKFDIFISVENYLTKADSITILHDQIGESAGESGSGVLEGRGPSFTKVLPFLTTGKDEIIAVTYYETGIEVSRQSGGSKVGSTQRELVTVTVPVQAKEDHKIIFSSSELDTVNPIHPTMSKGDNVVVVFGKTGTVAPEDEVIFSITDNEGVKTVVGNPVGPIEEDMSLNVESLLPMILAENPFPTLAYLDDMGDEEEEEVVDEDIVVIDDSEEEEEEDPRLGVTPFIEDAILTFSANEFVEAKSETIKKNQPYVLSEMISTKVGETAIGYQMGGFIGGTEIITHSTDPSEIHLSYPKNILTNSNTLATIQLLDSGGNPVYAKEDIIVKLVSNNEQTLMIPQELNVKKGEYFTTFNLESIDEGEIEVAILSENFPLSKYDVNVIDITPVLSLNLLGNMNWNERIEAQLSVTIPEIETSLTGFNVEWIAEGGEVKSTEETTNSEGIAIMNIIPNDKDKVSITVKVSGNGLSEAEISKTVDILNIPIIAPVNEDGSGVETPNIESEGFVIDETMIILIIIPIGIVAALFFLKRTDRLDLITEKIPIGDGIGDKFEEIKEKISDIKNR